MTVVHLGRLIRFSIVGGLNTVIDFAFLNFFVLTFGLHALVANTLSVLIAMVISFFLNRRFVFSTGSRDTKKQFLQFLMITGMSVLIIQNVAIYAATNLLTPSINSLHTLISGALPLTISREAFALNMVKIFSVALSLAWNYTLYHKVVFKTHPDINQQ